jgi:hypothetical protein
MEQLILEVVVELLEVKLVAVEILLLVVAWWFRYRDRKSTFKCRS